MAVHASEAVPDDRGDYLAAPSIASRGCSHPASGAKFSRTVQQLTRGALPNGVDLRDLGEHRLRDLLESGRVFQVLCPGLPELFPQLMTLDSRPNNLPLLPTPFLGREQEVDQVIDLLARAVGQALPLDAGENEALALVDELVCYTDSAAPATSVVETSRATLPL